MSFKPLIHHLADTSNASFADFASRPGSQIKSPDEFERMKSHVLDLYQTVDVKSSFMLDSGQHIDCIPRDHQPALRGRPPATPPSVLPRPAGSSLPHGCQYVPTQFGHGKKDTAGNVQNCPKGHVPMPRVDLQTLARFETLEQFFRKGPNERFKGRLTDAPSWGNGQHNYAHAYQPVDNRGGTSFLNVWTPAVSPQIFSLSQQWYVAGSGSNLQTVEGGWQVFPEKYGTTLPCLFIYWSNNNYSQGNYNLDAPAFVMNSNVWTPGGTLSPSSASGGAMLGITMQWQLDNGNWWLGIDNGTFTWVGYYPGSLWGGGPITQGAVEIDYGGETVMRTATPQMGSGAFAAAGPGQAAFQSSINYITRSNQWATPTLTTSQPTPNWYTASSAGSTMFYFGGPGGSL